MPRSLPVETLLGRGRRGQGAAGSGVGMKPLSGGAGMPSAAGSSGTHSRAALGSIPAQISEVRVPDAVVSATPLGAEVSAAVSPVLENKSGHVP